MTPRPMRGQCCLDPTHGLEFRGDEWREIAYDQTGNGHHLYGPWRKDDIDAAWGRVVRRNALEPKP